MLRAWWGGVSWLNPVLYCFPLTLLHSRPLTLGEEMTCRKGIKFAGILTGKCLEGQRRRGGSTCLLCYHHILASSGCGQLQLYPAVKQGVWRSLQGGQIPGSLAPPRGHCEFCCPGSSREELWGSALFPGPLFLLKIFTLVFPTGSGIRESVPRF